MDEATNEHIDVQEDHYKLVREMGAASVVLLKNVNGTLPLKKPRSLLLAGSDAGPGKIGPNGFSQKVRRLSLVVLDNVWLPLRVDWSRRHISYRMGVWGCEVPISHFGEGSRAYRMVFTH